MPIYRLDPHVPQIDATAYVADGARVVGMVSLAEYSSVWFGAVLRGDCDRLTIGRRSNVQDGCVLHSDTGIPTTVGDGVTVGHQVMLHGCTIGDGSLIGMQSMVMNGARIGRNCLVAAGSLVTEGKEFPDRWLILGRPAKAVRPLTNAEIDELVQSAQHYVDTALRYATACARLEAGGAPR